MATRFYSSVATEKTISTTAVSTGSTSVTLNDKTGLPSVPFTLVLSPDTASEEIVTCTANPSGTTYTITRAEEGTGPAKDHAIGNSARHMITARDLTATQTHYDATAAHGVGEIVGRTESQELTNKRLTLPKINEAVNLTATSTELNVLDGITASTAQLNYVNGVTSAIQTQLNTKAPSVNPEFTGTVTIPSGTNGLSPVGSVTMWVTGTAPTGWLLCQGQAVSRTTYAALWDVLRAGTSSSPYGNGDGSTTFNLPDLLGRVPMGAGTGTGLSARTLGTELGVESVTLTSAQSGVPAHSHDNTVALSGDGAHAHNIKTRRVTSTTHDHDNTETTVGPSTAPGSGGNVGTTQTDAALSRGHSHTVSITNVNNTAADAASSHENIQPSTVINFIIKH